METIRIVRGMRLCFVGQLLYESSCGDEKTYVGAFSGVGVRLYRQMDDGPPAQYLCVEHAETGEEKWYRIDGASLAPVQLGPPSDARAPADSGRVKRPR